MKNKLSYLLAGAAFVGSYANAEIILTDDLSAYGYIDAAYTDANDGTNLTGGTAEFELGFAFAAPDSPWSAVAEISYDNDESDSEFETVVITYAYSDELSFTVGNILSYQGFETYDATGLYQYSYQGYANTPVYSAAYAQGASADYVADDFALGAWIGETDGDASLEFLAAYTGVDGLTVKFIYADDPGYETYNVWGSYEVDALTLAAEYTSTDHLDGTDDDVYMALAFYSFGDAGLTLRYSGGTLADEDFNKFTVSPSYSFSDNVFGLLEVSLEDVDSADDEVVSFAAELIYSF